MIWKIPVRWEMTGLQAVEAGTLEEAIKCSCNEFNATDGEFVEGTLELDCDDVDLIRHTYNDRRPDGLDSTFPELLEYEKDEQNQWFLTLGADVVYGVEPNLYEIIFDVCNERYYCQVFARSVNEALGVFYSEHPHITYSMIVDHIEL